MPYSSYARNLNQIIDRTLRLIGDFVAPGGDGRMFRWAEIQDDVNRIVMDLVVSTGCLRNVQTIPLEEDVFIYNLPADCIRPLRIGMHGRDGYVMLPTSLTELDLYGSARSYRGDPLWFYREMLAPDEIGVLPIPYRDGSTSTKDSDYGLLRQVKDQDGNLLPYDANRPLRRVRGVPFTRSGTGRIVREVISTWGNLQVHYIRSPRLMEKPQDYPDSGIPEWIHQDMPYGVALRRLRGVRTKTAQEKAKRFAMKWQSALGKLQARIETTGSLGQEVKPI